MQKKAVAPKILAQTQPAGRPAREGLQYESTMPLALPHNG